MVRAAIHHPSQPQTIWTLWTLCMGKPFVYRAALQSKRSILCPPQSSQSKRVTGCVCPSNGGLWAQQLPHLTWAGMVHLVAHQWDTQAQTSGSTAPTRTNEATSRWETTGNSRVIIFPSINRRHTISMRLPMPRYLWVSVVSPVG